MKQSGFRHSDLGRLLGPYGLVGENIAAGSAGVAAGSLHGALMRSDSHRATLLGRLGIASASASFARLTGPFGSPRTSAARSPRARTGPGSRYHRSRRSCGRTPARRSAEHRHGATPAHAHARVHRRAAGHAGRSVPYRAGSSFVGTYAHGSLTMGCFNPTSSDLDLLIVTTGEVAAPSRPRAALLELSAPAGEGDRAVRRRRIGRRSFRIPDALRPAFLRSVATPVGTQRSRRDARCARSRPGRACDDDACAWNLSRGRADRCGVRRGAARALRRLHRPRRARVPRRARSRGVAETIATPVYAILNLCRVGAVVAGDHDVLSKAEGGQWAVASAPASAVPAIRNALAEYTVAGAAPTVTGPDLSRFTDWAVVLQRGPADPTCRRHSRTREPKEPAESRVSLDAQRL